MSGSELLPACASWQKILSSSIFTARTMRECAFTAITGAF
jgi:hypothetical protein